MDSLSSPCIGSSPEEPYEQYGETVHAILRYVVEDVGGLSELCSASQTDEMGAVGSAEGNCGSRIERRS